MPPFKKEAKCGQNRKGHSDRQWVGMTFWVFSTYFIQRTKRYWASIYTAACTSDLLLENIEPEHTEEKAIHFSVKYLGGE